MDFAPDPAILRCVPHRPPILRVHRLGTVDGGTGEAFGHEPTGSGALPWSMGAIEGIAQSAALLLAQGAAPADGPPRGMLVGVRQYTVAATPPPDAEIRYLVTVVRRVGPTVLVRGEASVDGVVLARGDLTLWIAPAAPR